MIQDALIMEHTFNSVRNILEIAASLAETNASDIPVFALHSIGNVARWLLKTLENDFDTMLVFQTIGNDLSCAHRGHCIQLSQHLQHLCAKLDQRRPDSSFH